jgi:ribosomal protein S18 acetylase RimI-like enzyme
MTVLPAQVRTARAQDAEGIARVHVDSWRETYAGLVPERFFDEDAFQARREMWNRYLALDAPFGSLVVAERTDRVVGFAFAASSHVADAEKGHEPARDLHLFSIYLLNAEQGAGAGRALLEAAIGDQPAQLWVARENSRARAFYERNGFRADGVQVTDLELEGLTEIRMVR